jgi:hypothetical protein
MKHYPHKSSSRCWQLLQEQCANITDYLSRKPRRVGVTGLSAMKPISLRTCWLAEAFLSHD